MRILISITLISILLACCNTKDKSNEGSSQWKHLKDSFNINKRARPYHYKTNRDSLIKYNPGILDTIKDLRVVGSELIDMNPGNEIIVSLLHNTGTFDQIFICSHDKNLKLIDSYYLGKATMFDGSSHTIESTIIDNNNIRIDHVDWGFSKRGKEIEIDTLKTYSYNIRVDEFGKISRIPIN